MKVKIIAEIGSNWEGDLAKARKIIKECKKAGADAVKFQIWRASELYPKHPNYGIIKRSEVTFEKARKLKKISDKEGIEFFCSVFYPEAIKFLENMNVKQYKIASRTCLLRDPHSLEIMQQTAMTDKPVIISMGMGGNRRLLERTFARNKTTFCYCISEYPLKIEKIDWKKAVKYNGFSDHTLGIVAPIIFTVLKKQQGVNSIIIEKHVKLKESKGLDAPASIDTDELAQLVSHLRVIEKTTLPRRDNK